MSDKPHASAIAAAREFYGHNTSGRCFHDAPCWQCKELSALIREAKIEALSEAQSRTFHCKSMAHDPLASKDLEIHSPNCIRCWIEAEIARLKEGK